MVVTAPEGLLIITPEAEGPITDQAYELGELLAVTEYVLGVAGCEHTADGP